MTEENIQKDLENKILKKTPSANLANKKHISSSARIIIFVAISAAAYFGFKYFKIKEAVRLNAKTEVSKFDAIESEIFDLADEYKNQMNGESSGDISEISSNEIKEKGAGFIYKMLLKNQIQLNDLKGQIQSLKTDFSKYKSQEKTLKIIFTYVDLRQKVFARNNENYEETLKSLELLASTDSQLQEKVTKLRSLLKDFSGEKALSAKFHDLIPEMIITKNQGAANDSFISKIRRHLSKLIIVRRIDEKNPMEVDAAIVKVEKLLQEQNYQEALTALVALDQTYHEIIVGFLETLNNASELQKLDRDIFAYLKNLGQEKLGQENLSQKNLSSGVSN